VAQHQSQYLISANQQLKICYLTFSSVRAVSLFSADRYLAFVSLLTHAHQPVTDCFHSAKLTTLFRKFCNNCGSVSKTNVSIRALSSYDILPI